MYMYVNVYNISTVLLKKKHMYNITRIKHVDEVCQSSNVMK